jgi:hypothetical protein
MPTRLVITIIALTHITCSLFPELSLNVSRIQRHVTNAYNLMHFRSDVTDAEPGSGNVFATRQVWRTARCDALHSCCHQRDKELHNKLSSVQRTSQSACWASESRQDSYSTYWAFEEPRAGEVWGCRKHVKENFGFLRWTPRFWASVYWRFGGTYQLHSQGSNGPRRLAVMMMMWFRIKSEHYVICAIAPFWHSSLLCSVHIHLPTFPVNATALYGV